MNLRELSTIGRPVDADYPSNVFILVFSFAIFLGFGISSYLSGSPFLESLVFGVRSFISVFFAWALGREVDPDRPLSAGLAAVGQVVVIWFIDVPSLMLSFWALFTFRVLNRSTGLKAGPADTLIATGVAAWLGYQLSWVIAGASAVVFFADALMEEPNSNHLIPGALLFGEGLVFLIFDPSIWVGYLNYTVKFGIVIGISITFLLVIYNNKTVSSVADETNEPLSSRRVQLTQLVALLVAILLPLWSGVWGFHQSATLWSVLGGTSLVQLISYLTPVFG